MTAIESAPRERSQDGGRSRVAVGREELIYRPDAGPDDPHFFRDLARWQVHRDARARDRLHRHGQQSDRERRDTSTSAYGALVVPQFLVDLAAGQVRAGSPLLAALRHLPLPTEGVTFTVPRGVTQAGSVAFAQTSQNAAVSESDPSTVNIERSLVAVAGQVTVSFQTLDRAPSVSEPYIARDLTEAIATKIDDQLINGTGANGQLLGLRSVVASQTVMYTDATPTQAEFVNFTARAASSTSLARLQSPDLVVMHHRRWYWLMGAVGSATSGNATVVTDQVCAEYDPESPYVGSIVGLPVVVDANIPTTVSNAVSNEDIALVIRSRDMPVHLGDVRVEVDRQTEAGTLEVNLVAWQYAVWFPDRYRGASTAILTGTGLATPVF